MRRLELDPDAVLRDALADWLDRWGDVFAEFSAGFARRLAQCAELRARLECLRDRQ